MNKNLPISKWSKEDRPREKMLTKGVEALSNAELLAILMRSGNREDSAVELAKKILKTANNNLNELGKFKIDRFLDFKGIGEAKAISILAALELGRRRNLSNALIKKTIKTSKEAFLIFKPRLADKNIEEFWVLGMKKNVINYLEKINSGGLDTSLVDIRILMKNLLDKEATAFIVAHNHPSGNKLPSESDKSLTAKIKQASAILNIQLLDHLIIAGNTYFSFADENIL